MQVTTCHGATAAAWADALFVSVLQRSDEPDAGQVRQAIAATVRAYGDQGCAQRVAQEFGDHPETAVARMHWARAVASTQGTGREHDVDLGINHGNFRIVGYRLPDDRLRRRSKNSTERKEDKVS